MAADVPHRDVYARYHFYAFVFNTKAFLDKTAAYLNAQYDLGLKRGAIDLRRGEFALALKKRRRVALLRQIQLHGPWFDEVSDWRNHLIHRQGVFIYGGTWQAGGRWTETPEGRVLHEPARRQLRIPGRPSPRERAGGRLRMPLFCDRWLGHSEAIMEAVCADSDRLLRRKAVRRRRTRAG